LTAAIDSVPSASSDMLALMRAARRRVSDGDLPAVTLASRALACSCGVSGIR
jgi:hypothetical protein